MKFQLSSLVVLEKREVKEEKERGASAFDVLLTLPANASCLLFNSLQCKEKHS